MLTEPNSGLGLTLYRAYNLATGRWLSRDPAGEAADQNANLYAYVNANPINDNDPLGLCPNSKTCDGIPGFSTFNLAAQIAINENPVNDYTPAWLRGIIIHYTFANLIKIQPGYGSIYNVNVSYYNGGVASWFTPDSSRPDGVYGPIDHPDFVVELKTGNARLRNPQLSKYYKNLPNGTPICVIHE